MDDIIVCPKCFRKFVKRSDGEHCSSCGMTFPVYAGIPDFRGVDPDFQPGEQEIKIRDALLSAYDSASFENLIERRFNFHKGRKDLSEKQKAFELSYEKKGAYRAFQINKLLEDSGRVLTGDGVFLDIGCGSGTAVPWIMKGFKRGIGVDFSLVDLIMGSKFLEERGISNLKLVCADARKLPFSQECFDFVNAMDVIEHILPGQERFMMEVKRVLKHGGGFYFNSPNRFNIFTPEPHVKVRFVGFMPRAWMDRYVQMMKGVRYTTIRLLSLSELKRLVRTVYGDTFILTGPFIDFNSPATDFKRKVVKKIPVLLKLINRLFLFYTTNFQVILFKRGD